MKLDQLPPVMRAQVLARLSAEDSRRGPIDPPVRPETAAKDTSGRGGEIRKLNKTEQRFLVDWPPARSGLILAQALTLPFGDGTSYRPDFVLAADGRLTIYEVKGGHVGKVAWSRHGIERFRRAREMFKEFEFELWQWWGGEWTRKL